MAMTLTEFLRARLDEEEQWAITVAAEAGREWEPGDEMLGGTVNQAGADGHGYLLCAPYDGDLSWSMRNHVARHDPARVLAEVEAKRRMLDWLDAIDRLADGCDELASHVLSGHLDTDRARELLALPHADHPDYRQEWRP